MQLIDLGQEVEYIDIDVSKVPYTFSVKLSDKTYSFTIRYNDTGGFFTLDLSVTATGEVLAYGDPIRYGRPLFGPIEDERFPLPVIIPLCLTGDDVDAVTWENRSSSISSTGRGRHELLDERGQSPDWEQEVQYGQSVL